MYYTKQKGFGPFKRWALMEQVTPRHKEQEIGIKSGFIYTEDGRRPISSAKIKIDKDGYIIFEGTGKTSVKAESFEAYAHGFVFKTPNGAAGYVARNGNVVNPAQKGENNKPAATITNVDVFGKVIVYQKVRNRDNVIYYTVGDALSGLEVLPGQYTSYSFGDRQEGIPSRILILGNPDGTQTIANDKFAVLSDTATKVEKSDETLYILSNTPNGRYKTVLEAFHMPNAVKEIPTLKFLENGVIDFTTSYRELITYNGETSSVYDITPYAENSVYPRFTKEGQVANIAPMFSGLNIYVQSNGEEKTLLHDNGEACTNPNLKGFKGFEHGHGGTLIVSVDTPEGAKKGLVNGKNLTTVLPSVYDKIRFFGQTEEGLCVATFNDTFRIDRIEECGKDLYMANPLLAANNYFRAQLTNKEGVLYAEDSVGMPVVVDCTGRDNQPVVDNVVNKASKDLGIPLPEKEVQFVE